MKALLLPIMIITLYSCSSKNTLEKSRQEKIFTFSKANLKEVDSSYVLDSVRILDYDTVTDFNLEVMRFKKIMSKINDNQEIIRLKQSKTETNIQIARLSSGIDDVLVDTYRNDAKKLMKEVDDLMLEDSIYRQEMNLLSIRMEKADTIKLKYLQVRSLRQIKRPDLSVLRDTIFTFFDPMGNIIRQEDIK